jgi:hypothetical protein
MMIGYFSMILVDQDLTKHPKGQSRVERFREELRKSGPPKASDALKAKAADALDSYEKLMAFMAELEKTVPQVDRIDVTTVADETLTIRLASQSGEVARRVGAKVSLPAAKLALADYAKNEKLTVHGDLSKERAPDLVFAARMLSSSMHVPITLDGEKGTVNVWSMERDAFPQEAVALIREAVGAMKK